MKKKILLACLLSSSVALACQVIDGSGFYFPSFPNIPGGCVGNCGGTVTVGEVIPT